MSEEKTKDKPVTKTLFTIPLPKGMAFSLSVKSDLGVWQPMSKTYMLLGWSHSKTRLDAVSRIKMVMVVIGPVAVTFSRVYVRR